MVRLAVELATAKVRQAVRVGVGRVVVRIAVEDGSRILAGVVGLAADAVAETYLAGFGTRRARWITRFARLDFAIPAYAWPTVRRPIR